MQETSHSFVGRIRDSLEDLPSKERRLADFVLDFPGDLASYTASELAVLADVSNSTVSRFIRRLGYESFDEARRQVRAEKETGSPLFLSEAHATSESASLDGHLQQSQRNLTATFAATSGARIAEVAQGIAGANRVLVVGYRSSHAFAVYFRWQIIQVAENTLAIPGAGETIGEYLAGLNPGDFLVVFGMRRRVQQLAAVIAFAAKAGAKILYITDSQSPPHPKATWTIHCVTTGPGPLDNHVAVMALCDVLATRVMDLKGATGRKRLAAIEVAHEAVDEMASRPR
ncbi:MurR/RpiR family transcriptional regulator [Paraburkholderia silvatlantica]|uniref:DNA-binding MurR/RpiR family transcriptional regulator n=1 Tax=Paraburkholderia silvatlantica TaxID=321895 RepID=A0ABR6FZU5_9BURK|nr:MurR/RpiR family transcriptional regulator [Paraburkholderia silvatlantica]MBB2932960.1 DNA-binding MurR/RpiR family transcriptional regulator [Paraburkholderia silvatlantica]PVY16814.1 RpiR family transcriptional regulator [Paraburkholderia silvatlantica]PXW23505.1 RpiR family transcriptional regulator [Paraburkholderia silvatlantica]